MRFYNYPAYDVNSLIVQIKLKNNSEFLTAGFGLTQHWLFQIIRKLTESWKTLSLFLYHCLSC